MWLNNCWYVIAWEHEVAPGALFARRVLNQPIVVYRTAAGGLVALQDRCCHRHAPLSKGRLEGDCLRCGYHGLKFDAAGVCIEAPGMEQPPPQARVRSYPVRAHNGWVFVWMGDPDRADATMLPDNFSNQHPDWQNRPGYLHYDTAYLLICDNLLDFSHLSYVHEKSLGGSTAIARARAEIEPVDKPGQRGIRVKRLVRDVPAPPFYQRFRRFTTHLDRWFDYEFLLPGTLLMHSGGRPVGEDSMDNAVQLHSCQTLTPESETSTHYFFQQSHRRGFGDASVTDSIYNSLIGAFNEDRDMITAQQRNLLLDPEAPMLPLHFDAALMRFRKLLADEKRLEEMALKEA
jgi:phenylpropionate dioxygenase-like ring-hydroxylating dioxygenase large terminal subunit